MIRPTLRSVSPVLFATLAAAISGCQPATLSVGTYASGSIAVSKDGNTVFIADDDNNQLVMVDPAKRSVIGTVNVGNQPASVMVAPSGEVYVSNRGSRSVSVVDPTGNGKVVATIPVGTEPVGLGLTADGKTLVVANSTNASVSLVDVASKSVRATVQNMDPDPTNVSVLPNGDVWVTHQRTGTVSVIDVQTASVQRTFAIVVPSSATGGGNRLPNSPLAPVLAGGNRVYIINSQSLLDPVNTSQNSTAIVQQGGGSPYAGVPSDSGLASAIVAPAVASIDTTNVKAPAIMLGADTTAPTNGGAVPNLGPEGTMAASPVGPEGKSLHDVVTPTIATTATEPRTDVPPFLLTVANQSLSGPSASVVDPTGRFIFVANKNSNNVAIVDTAPQPAQTNVNTGPTGAGFASPPTTANGANIPAQSGPPQLGFGMHQLISVGAGPTGLAIPPSGDRVYAYSAFDHTLSVIMANKTKTADEESDRFSVGSSPLMPQIDLGRRLFFSAADSRMTSNQAGGIACASCHPNGREDGRTWTFTEGPRNTPMLAGRDLGQIAPYHWDGKISTFHDFNTVITQRMGGVGDGTGPQGDGSSLLAQSDFDAMLAYIDTLPAPDNPFVATNDPAAIQRGAGLFASPAVGCASCHNGADFTDKQFHNVGTMTNNTLDGNSEQVSFAQTTATNGNDGSASTIGVKTPALHNLFASAPYLHDGSAASLLARVQDDRGGWHGHTEQLTPDQQADLVAFLQTL